MQRAAWGDAYLDSGLVFTHEDGSPLHPEWVSKRFDRLIKGAGVPRLTFHGLRHLSASLQLAAGVPMAVVSKRLGHTSISLTVNLYGHLLDGAGREAAERSRALLPRSVLTECSPDSLLTEGLGTHQRIAAGQEGVGRQGLEP